MKKRILCSKCEDIVIKENIGKRTVIGVSKRRQGVCDRCLEYTDVRHIKVSIYVEQKRRV